MCREKGVGCNLRRDNEKRMSAIEARFQAFSRRLRIVTLDTGYNLSA